MHAHARARDLHLPHGRAGEHTHTAVVYTSVHERKEEQPIPHDPEDEGREDPRSARRRRHGEESLRDDKARGRGHHQYGESAEAHPAEAARPPLPSTVPAVELAGDRQRLGRWGGRLLLRASSRWTRSGVVRAFHGRRITGTGSNSGSGKLAARRR